MPKTNSYLSGDKETNGKDSYNNIPVEWCARCKSLKILSNSESSYKLTGIKCYCGECNSTSLSKGHIDQWEQEFKEITSLEEEMSDFDRRQLELKKQKSRSSKRQIKNDITVAIKKW